MSDSKSFKIANIVASIRCTHPIPLDLIQHIPGVRYNFSRFKCAMTKLTNGSANIFRNGKIVFLGFKNIPDIDTAVHQLKAKLGRFMIVGSAKPIVSNIVARIDVATIIDPTIIQTRAPKLSNFRRVYYEPELSNMIQIHFNDSMRFMVHTTGKGFITGGRDVSLMLQRFDSFKAILP